MTLPAIRESAGGLVIPIAARPGQPRSAVLGVHGEALKVSVAAPPEKGKANDELVRFLAKALGLSRAQVTLVAGQGSRDKAVRLEGISRDALETKLRALLG